MKLLAQPLQREDRPLYLITLYNPGSTSQPQTMGNDQNLCKDPQLRAAVVPDGAAEAHGASAAQGGWEKGKGNLGIWESEGTWEPQPGQGEQ